MAMTGVLRPGFVQLRVRDMDAALKHYVGIIGLSEAGRGADGRVYLRAFDEFDRHSVILRADATAGMDATGFKVADEATLDTLAGRIEAFGLEVAEVAAGEQPGVGRRVGFTIPSGHRIELYARMEQSPQAPSTTNPDLWPDEPRGMKAVRFDHTLLYGPDIDEVAALFTEALGFGLAERLVMPDGVLGAWLSCSTKAHDIAFVKHAEPGKFHHASFFLESWHDVGHAADLIARHNVPLDIGPTRHGITRGQTIYFFDPSGNRNEVFTGGYMYYPDNPTRTWDQSEIGKSIFYYEKELNDRFLGVVT